MPQPDRQEYVDNQLSDFAQAYFQSSTNFAATKVFPQVTVSKQEAKYHIFDKNDLLRESMEVRPNGGPSRGGGFGLSNDSYIAEVYASHKQVTDRDRKNWTQSNLTFEEATAQVLAQRALQKIERQWVTDFFAASIWETDVTGGVDFTAWSTPGSSDPIVDIDTGKLTVLNSTGFEPRVLACGFKVWQNLRRHPLIVDRVTGGGNSQNPATVSKEAVAAVLDLDKIHVLKAVKATNVEGGTAATSQIAGNHALLCHVPDAPSIVEPSAGYTFVWDGVGGGMLDDGGNVAISSIPDPLNGRNTTREEIEIGFDNKVTGSDLGYMLLSAVA